MLINILSNILKSNIIDLKDNIKYKYYRGEKDELVFGSILKIFYKNKMEYIFTKNFIYKFNENIAYSIRSNYNISNYIDIYEDPIIILANNKKNIYRQHNNVYLISLFVYNDNNFCYYRENYCNKYIKKKIHNYNIFKIYYFNKSRECIIKYGLFNINNYLYKLKGKFGMYNIKYIHNIYFNMYKNFIIYNSNIFHIYI